MCANEVVASLCVSKATFGVPIKVHKEIKGLDPQFKNQNLRDHMTDLELIFSMLGERLTTEATRKKDAQGLVENKEAARRGKVAGRRQERCREYFWNQSGFSETILWLGFRKEEIKRSLHN